MVAGLTTVAAHQDLPSAQVSWWRQVDLNVRILAVVLAAVVLHVLWTLLPAVAPSFPWIMEVTSSGHKLDAFHVAVEQSRLKREPVVSRQSFHSKHEADASVLNVPLYASKAVGYNHDANAFDVNLTPVSLPHSQGRRAIALAGWVEDGFPSFERSYYVALADHEPLRASCRRIDLALNTRKLGDLMLLGVAGVRYVLSVSPDAKTKFEPVRAAKGGGVEQPVMLGVRIESIAIVDQFGKVLAGCDSPA